MNTYIDMHRELEKTFEDHKEHYPKDHGRATIKSLLRVAQEIQGYVSAEAVKSISQILNLTESEVYEVASFYSLYDLSPVGKFKIALCTNVSCYLRGSEQLQDCLKRKLKIDFGQTTEDGIFTLKEVECLAACAQAPVLQINGSYWENVDEASLSEWIEHPKDLKK